MSLSHLICRRFAHALALSTLVLVCSPVASAEKKVASALDFVPADASFYSSSLRWGEQLEIVRQSKAWKRIQEMPAVQMGWQLLEAQIAQPDSPLDVAQQLLQLPENQQLLELLVDMASNEVFVYGDPSVTRFVTALAEGYGDAQATNMSHGLRQALSQAGALGGPRAGRRDAQNNREGARAFLQALTAHVDDLTIPNLVLGFRLSKTEPAQTQLKRLEVLAKMALKQSPVLKDRLKRIKIDDTQYLTLSLDGSLVPWQEIRWQDFEDQPGEFAPLVKKLKSLTLSLTLGVRGEYLLASLGSSTEHLAQLGKGELLVDRPEFKPLVALGGKPLTGVVFCSGDLRTALSTTKKDVQQLTETATRLLDQLEIKKSLRKRILADVKSFVADVTRYVPDVGPILGFSFLTDRGFESYVYDWNENLFVDGEKPLTLLDHLGGNPLAAIVVRGKYDPQQWDLLVKWMQIGYGYFQEFALPQMPAEDRANFDKIADLALPLIERLNNVTRDLLIPALSDGQSALVLDAKIVSRQWQKDMPAGTKPLPMLEPAVVLGVSDAKLLKRAMKEYLEIANTAIEQIRKVNPRAIPADFHLPAPEKSESKSGDDYAYPLPAELGIDPQIVLASGLSESVWVAFSVAREQTQALLDKKPLALPEVLGDDKRPLAAVAWLNWAGLVDAVKPWVDYAARVGNGRQTGDVVPEELDPQSQFILDQVQTGLEVLKVLRSYASVTHVEGKSLVVHSEVHFQDLD